MPEIVLFRLPAFRALPKWLPAANGLPRLRGVSTGYLPEDELGAMAPDSAVSPTRPRSCLGADRQDLKSNHHNPTLAGEAGRKEGRSQGVLGSFYPLPQRRTGKTKNQAMTSIVPFALQAAMTANERAGRGLHGRQ